MGADADSDAGGGVSDELNLTKLPTSALSLRVDEWEWV